VRLVERHFHHFEPREPTPERWVQQCEVRFECHWVRLHPRLPSSRLDSRGSTSATRRSM